MTKEMRTAVAYFRTSSATNVGTDKDSLKRQQAVVAEIVESYHDAAVSGADPVDARPGFADMLKRIAGNGVRTIIVETANRFAREFVQEMGFRFLQGLGVTRL